MDYKSGYELALEAAGAQVLEYSEFGQYEGSWWAKIIHEGQTGWVTGGFGSCSVCDPYEHAQWEYEYRFDEAAQKYVEVSEEEKREGLIQFGQAYLDDVQTAEEVRAWVTRTLAKEYLCEEDKQAAQFLVGTL